MSRAETLNDLLDAAGMTMDAVAKRAGISLRALLSLRSGTVEVARAKTVGGLAKALRIPAARVRAAIEASRAARG